MSVPSKDMVLELTFNNRNTSLNFYPQVLKSLREISTEFLAQEIEFAWSTTPNFNTVFSLQPGTNITMIILAIKPLISRHGANRNPTRFVSNRGSKISKISG
jgi:hypothetical protein